MTSCRQEGIVHSQVTDIVRYRRHEHCQDVFMVKIGKSLPRREQKKTELKNINSMKPIMVGIIVILLRNAGQPEAKNLWIDRESIQEIVWSRKGVHHQRHINLYSTTLSAVEAGIAEHCQGVRHMLLIELKPGSSLLVALPN